MDIQESRYVGFWHRLEDEIEIGGLFEILLPLILDKREVLKTNIRRQKWAITLFLAVLMSNSNQLG